MTQIVAKKTKVPSTRFGRFARIGLAAGELALGGVTEGFRSIGRKPDSAASLFLTARNAKNLADRLAGMRGAAMKMGQILSMEGTDFLPREFADALAILRNTANTMPDTQLRRVMGREYGKGWEALFEAFDYEPIAAASIGQVHRATALDGRQLALKIQYPGVFKSIGSDIDNLAMLLRMSRILPAELDISPSIRDAKRQLRLEADYVHEAKVHMAYRKLIRDNDSFLVPSVHEDLSSRHILAMDYVQGVPLESLGDAGIAQSKRDQVGTEMLRLVFRELFEFRTMQSDPNFANYMYQPDEERIVLLDFGSTVTFEPEFTDQYAGITSALLQQDHPALRHYAEELGYLSADGDQDYATQVLKIIDLIYEPLRTRGAYDFGASDLFSRARDIGMDMFLNGKQHYVVPPPATTFLHRKLMGTFMLCSRIKARVDVAELVQPYLAGR